MPGQTKRRRATASDPVTDWLSTLPTELIELIAESVPAPDILSFRLTCRNLYACASRPYVRNYIARRPFLLYNQASLDELMELVADPNMNQHMHIIAFSHACLVGPEQDHMRRQRQYEKEASNSRSLRARKREQRGLYRILESEELPLYVDGAQRAVQSAISIMRDRGIPVGIRCTGLGIPRYSYHGPLGTSEDPAPWGYDRLCDNLGYRGCMDKRVKDHNAFFVLLDAIAEAQIAPPVLELGDNCHGIPIDIFDGHFIVPGLEHDLFRNLETLRLGLTLGNGWFCMWDSDQVDLARQDVNMFLDSFTDALYFAPRLRTLGLTILPHEYDAECLSGSVITALLSASSRMDLFPKLENLELQGHYINPFDLLTFLQPICKRLRKLDLRYIRHQESAWADRIEYPEVVDNQTTSLLWYCIIKEICTQADLGWYKVFDGGSWSDRESERRFPIRF